MNPKTLISVSRAFAAGLGLSVCAWLLAAQLVAPVALERWRTAWLLLCSIGIAGTVLPLALAHALLAAWADEVIERVDRLLEECPGRKAWRDSLPRPLTRSFPDR
jgi:hypothetical protein